MLIKTFFKVIGEQKNWTYGKDYMFGYEGEYFVQVRHEGLGKVIAIHYKYEKDETKLKKLDIIVSKSRKKIKISNFQVNHDGIVIQPNEFWKTLNKEKLQNILDYTINALSNLGLEPSVENVIVED